MNFTAILASVSVCLCYLRLVRGEDDDIDSDKGFRSTEQRNLYPGQYPLPSLQSRQAKPYLSYDADDDVPQSGEFGPPSNGFVRPPPFQGRIPTFPSGHINTKPSLSGNVPMYHGGVDEDDEDETKQRDAGFVAPPISQVPVTWAGAVQPPLKGGLPLLRGNHEQNFPRTEGSNAQDSEELDREKFSHPQHQDDENRDEHQQTRLSSSERNQRLGLSRQSAYDRNGGVSSGEAEGALDTSTGSNGKDGDDASYHPVTIPINDKVKSSIGHTDSAETGYKSGEVGREIAHSVSDVNGESSGTSQSVNTGAKESDEEAAKTPSLWGNHGSSRDPQTPHSQSRESNKGQESLEDGYSDGEKGKTGDLNRNRDDSDSNENDELGASQIYNGDERDEYDKTDGTDVGRPDEDDGKIDDSHDDDSHANSKGGDEMDSHFKDNAGAYSNGDSNDGNGEGTSRIQESVGKSPLNDDHDTGIPKEDDDSSENLSSEDSLGKSDDSRENRGEDSDGDEGGYQSDDDGDSKGYNDDDDSGRERCTVNAVGRCLGRLANFHSRTLPTHLFSTVEEFCSAVGTMNRCFGHMRNNCPDDVLYRVNVLRQSTNYICNEKRRDFGEVYNCLLEATDRYSRCYESYTTTEGSVTQRKCRPVENFEECVAQVTEAECGQKAGNLVRNYYQQSKLNPLVDTDPDMVCPAIESLQQEDGTPDRQKTVLAVGLTLAGCVALAAGVVISAIVGAHKRTQMAHYILQDA